MNILHLCLALALANCVSADAPASLRMVHLLFRHCDRSPEYISPNDINQVDVWPDGLAWLTKLGKQQQYELGQYLRKRYTGFLSKRYTHDEIQVEAADWERNLLGAYTLLAGMFPAEGDQQFYPGFVWQPVPVSTPDLMTDRKLAFMADCDKWDVLYKQVETDPTVLKEVEEFQDMFDKLGKASGATLNFRQFWEWFDPLECERNHNMTMNSWVYEPGLYEWMEALRHRSFALHYRYPEMVKIIGSTLMNETVNHMVEATTQDAPMPKFYFYCGHDITIAAMLSMMDAYDQRFPNFGSYMITELHEIKGKYVVRIFYRNETPNPEPVQIPLPGCGFDCELTQFIDLVKDKIPADWHKNCEIDKPWSPAIWFVVFVGVCVFGVLVVALGVMLLRLWRRRNGVYTQL